MVSGYTDQNGNSHIRKVREIENGWEIIDDIKGRFKSAELQWILKPGNWHLNGESISLDNTEISMDSNNKFISRLEEHFESIYYMEKTMVPILKIKISNQGSIRTQIKF